MSEQWWESFFDSDYIRVWGAWLPPEKNAEEADGLWRLLDLREGVRILDAPCGYGRLSLPLAERGAAVLGVDQSAAMIAEAEKRRGDLPAQRLRYLRRDLRVPLEESGFDVALNVFSSLGYGTEDDDVAVLTTLAKALRGGGKALVETNHRDAAVAFLSRGATPAFRMDDGTLVVETPRLDAVAGRIETCWYWSGPKGSGEKRASLRLYTVTELVDLLERAGLRFVSAHAGCSPEPYQASGPEMGGRVGLLATKP